MYDVPEIHGNLMDPIIIFNSWIRATKTTKAATAAAAATIAEAAAVAEAEAAAAATTAAAVTAADSNRIRNKLQKHQHQH